MSGGWTRRRLLRTMLGSSALMVAGCGRSNGRLPPQGEIVGASRQRGHRLRQKADADLEVADWKTVDVVIVGAGVAGLACSWELRRRGIEDLVVLELEDHPGGTSRGGAASTSLHPWGAHYLPAPLGENRSLIELLEEMGVVSGYDAVGAPRYVEEHLCRDPQERLFFDGAWHEDLLPGSITSEDQAEWLRFRQEIERWVAWRDDQGRRAFAIPTRMSSNAPEVLKLDTITMQQWLDEQRFRGSVVRWEVDYACRDDYGTRVDQTSAWAGLFYFASRVNSAGDAPQPLLTWPEGNARLTNHLAKKLDDRLHTGMAVCRIVPRMVPDGELQVLAWDQDSERLCGWRAKHVVFAAPQFVAKYVVQGYARDREAWLGSFSYAPWLVANLHLTARPRESGFPCAWDNVLYDSPGLGYVVATHQSGRDHGPTVWTYYRPLCEQEPVEARAWLEQLTWAEGAELVLQDLEQAHPELRSLVQRLDLMHWGHAMVRPVPAFINGTARHECSQSYHGVCFAHSDLSGLALFEEAFDQGLRAASEVHQQWRTSG